jgi:hypothetical protein
VAEIPSIRIVYPHDGPNPPHGDNLFVRGFLSPADSKLDVHAYYVDRFKDGTLDPQEIINGAQETKCPHTFHWGWRFPKVDSNRPIRVEATCTKGDSVKAYALIALVPGAGHVPASAAAPRLAALQGVAAAAAAAQPGVPGLAAALPVLQALGYGGYGSPNVTISFPPPQTNANPVALASGNFQVFGFVDPNTAPMKVEILPLDPANPRVTGTLVPAGPPFQWSALFTGVPTGDYTLVSTGTSGGFVGSDFRVIHVP